MSIFSFTKRIVTAGVVSVMIHGLACAQEKGDDKYNYHLFNPTPDHLLRELSPDRPDATESPITVDAGRYVIEASFFDWRHDGGTDTYSLMSANLKAGLTHRTDVQFVFDSYRFEEPRGNSDFGDVQVRLKHNLWGNEEGDSALALFPFVKIPTHTDVSNGEWEGGLIIPFSYSLTDCIGLGLMAELDWVYHDNLADHEMQYLFSSVLGFDLNDRWGMFLEYIAVCGDFPYQNFAAGGFTYSVNDDLVLDCGTQVGLNRSSEELGVFAGFTKRF